MLSGGVDPTQSFFKVYRVKGLRVSKRKALVDEEELDGTEEQCCSGP